MKHAGAYAFFLIHLVGGFLMLWLCFYYVQITIADELDASLLLKTALETTFLLLTVIWGSVGWDSYKDLRSAVPGKDLATELATSTASLTIALPVFTAAFDFWVNMRIAGFSWGLRSIPLGVLSLAVVSGITLIVYGRGKGSRPTES